MTGWLILGSLFQSFCYKHDSNLRLFSLFRRVYNRGPTRSMVQVHAYLTFIMRVPSLGRGGQLLTPSPLEGLSSFPSHLIYLVSLVWWCPWTPATHHWREPYLITWSQIQSNSNYYSFIHCHVSYNSTNHLRLNAQMWHTEDKWLETMNVMAYYRR